MVDLDYYSEWYKTAPDWHRSIGVLLVGFIVLRLLWRWKNVTPAPLPEHAKWEKSAAHATHIILYILLLLMLPSGYLITTAEGQSLEVFNWFSLPATITNIDNLEDIAGEIHELLAYSIIALAVLHMLGALKHHFIDKDSTLKRMLGKH